MSKIHTIYQRLKYIILYGNYIPTQYYTYDDIKAVYIPIPKVACTSIKLALQQSEETYDEDSYDAYMDVHKNATINHERLSLYKLDDYFKFAFVRNPFDRLVSCYEDKVKKVTQHTGRYFFDTDYNNILIKRLFGNKFHHKMSFFEFAELVAKIPDVISDAHFRSQYSFLYIKNKPIVDYTGKLENLADDWAPLTDKFNIKAPHIKNKSERKDWKRYYTSTNITELVAERYRKDIKFFGYERDYKQLLNI